MAMLVGRFFMIIPMLAIAGNLARRRSRRPAGNIPVTTPLFTTLLISVIIIVGHEFSRC